MKGHPKNHTAPLGYADAKIACYILGISRRQLDRLADSGKIKRITIGWNTYFSLDCIIARRVAKMLIPILSPSHSQPKKSTIHPNQ